MLDPRIEKLAHLLVHYSVKIQPGDWVYVRGSVAALPLVEQVARQVWQAGGNATVALSNDNLLETFYRVASQDQIEWLDPTQTMLFEQVDALISIRASENTRALTNIDPALQAAASKARQPIMQTYMQRSAEGKLRWVGTQYPTLAYAQDADMSLSEYEDFVYGACAVDQADPVAYWQGIHKEQARLIEYLQGKKQMTVRGPNIDMSLSIEGRTFINSDGSHNMPSGEIFTGPVEDSVNGWVRFTYPAIRDGREVDGVEFKFENGKLTEASAKKNEAYLLSQLDSDAGARYLGEFAIGTNYNIQRFTKSILYDEKIGGTLHMAVGAGYPETGSQNTSNVHWDFICDMRDDSEIHVDGELFYKNGQFQV
ncbi:MAG: aminopeptidase [Anaerolineales bacterium]